jgi:hypothetical protein
VEKKKEKEMRRRIKNIEMKVKMKKICEKDNYIEMEEDCSSAENVNCLDNLELI